MGASYRQTTKSKIMEVTVPTQNEILKKALKKLVTMCYANKMQHGSTEMRTAMEYGELALKQPKLKEKACQRHSLSETSTEDTKH